MWEGNAPTKRKRASKSKGTGPLLTAASPPRHHARQRRWDVVSELLKCGLNDHARLEDSQLRRLFVDIPNIPFGNEYKRFVQVASDTGGRMHMSSTNGTMSFWAESAQGPKMFPIVLTVARRLAVFCLNVCSNERVFSLTGYMDDSRKAALDSGRFAKRVLIVGNGTRISLKARVTEAEQDNATGESK